MPKRPDVAEMEIWRELGTVTEDTGVRAYKDARLIDIARIRPNPRQPRQTSDQQALEELADSIRERGLLQPIVVRPEEEGDGFIIIAGHRRHAACKLIGMERIPSVIREINEHEALEQSLIENVQREDINPVEEAVCYRQLMDEHHYSIRDMAAKVHKSVGYIHGRLELLKHEDVAESVTQSEVGIYEARELAKVEDEETRQKLIEQVAAGDMDRKSLKREVKRLTGKLPPRPEVSPEPLEELDEGTSAEQPPEPAKEQRPKTVAEPPSDSVERRADGPHPEVPPEPSIETPLEPLEARPAEGVINEPTGEAEGLVVGQREGQRFLFDLRLFSRNWGQLHENLQTLDTEELEDEERRKVRQLLEEIKVTIEEMLARIE